MKRQMEWQNLGQDGWRLRRERHGHITGCMRWQNVGNCYPSIEGWCWVAAPESPRNWVNVVGGYAKNAKAAKLAVETALRVLEMPEQKKQRKPRARTEPGVRWVKVEGRPHWAE